MPQLRPHVVPHRTSWLLIAGAGLVLGLAMGTRQVQGLFMLPMLADRPWGREAFSFTLGLQTLVWGLLQPLTGWIADRHGTRPVIAVGSLLYAAGLWMESVAPSPSVLTLGAGVLVGAGLTATTFSVVYGAISRRVGAPRRGTALGLAGGVGGFVQFALVPAAQGGISTIGWSATLQAFAAFIAMGYVVARVLDDRGGDNGPTAPGADSTPAAWPVARSALTHSGFWLLNLGFVSCGFQLAFLGTHLPAYLQDAGMDASSGVTALALIALANTFGTFVCGQLGDRYRRKYLLSGVYALRTLAMALFVALPLSTPTLYGFAFVMGLSWLGTVPLTTGVLVQIFGVRHIGMLFGLVFLGHQLGGFFGAWLGGAVVDATGSYDGVWAISLALGLASVVLNLPIRDRPIAPALRPAAA